jgi:hypothetical protein
LRVILEETGVDGAFLFWKGCRAADVRPIFTKLGTTVDTANLYNVAEFDDDRSTGGGTGAIRSR